MFQFSINQFPQHPTHQPLVAHLAATFQLIVQVAVSEFGASQALMSAAGAAFLNPDSALTHTS